MYKKGCFGWQQNYLDLSYLYLPILGERVKLHRQETFPEMDQLKQTNQAWMRTSSSGRHQKATVKVNSDSTMMTSE